MIVTRWRRARLSLSLAAGLLGAGCGGSSVPAEAIAGARGLALAGHVEVTVLEPLAGAPVAGAVVRARSIATGALLAESNTDAGGHAHLAGDGLTGSIQLEAASPSAVQIFFGIRTDDVTVVLPGAAAAPARVSGNVRGLPAATTDVVVGAARELSLLRTVSLDAAATVPCAQEGDGCTFSLASEGAGTLAAATASDASGEVVGFVVGRLGAAGGTLDASLGAEDMLLGLPSAAGFTGIIGVPGVAEEGALVLLSQAQTSPERVRVPSLEGELADAAYWVLVEAHPAVGATGADPNARSVLFARGLHGAADAPSWTSWLTAPTATMDAAVSVTFDAVPQADVHVVDWIDASGRVRASAWLLDDTVLDVASLLPSGLAAGEVAEVRVRALDTVSPPTASGFDARAIELGATRFSERTLTR